MSSELPDNGLSGAYAAAVFARLGSAPAIDYFPWRRTMEMGTHDQRYAGLLAVLRTPQREAICHFSTPIGTTQIVLAYLRDSPVQVSSLKELKGAQLGTVAGYANGEAFDSLVRRGVLSVQEGLNDDINLRKLLNRRFDAMVVEKRVLRHLLASSRFSRAERERVAFTEHLFHERKLHICFQRSPAGLAQQRAFNDASREIDLARFERDYMRRLEADRPTVN